MRRNRMNSDPIPEEYGEVIEVRGNTAKVKLGAKQACAHCGVCAKIGNSPNEMLVEAYAGEPVEKGDKVALVIGNGMILKSAFVVYMVPLIALIAGYYIGKQLLEAISVTLKGELFPALFGLFLVGLSFFAIRWYDRRKKNDSRFRVTIRKIDS
jgi:sigma-E factor negative regulatory protein RseC